MPKRRKPCSAIQRCSPSENRRRRPFVQAQARRIRPARANRYTTDTAGGTAPNWKVIASQVDPQMRTEVRYRPRMFTSFRDNLETVGGGVNLIGRGFDSRRLHVAAAQDGRCAIGSYQGTFDGVARRRLSRARRRPTTADRAEDPLAGTPAAGKGERSMSRRSSSLARADGSSSPLYRSSRGP